MGRGWITAGASSKILRIPHLSSTLHNLSARLLDLTLVPLDLEIGDTAIRAVLWLDDGAARDDELPARALLEMALNLLPRGFIHIVNDRASGAVLQGVGVAPIALGREERQRNSMICNNQLHYGS